MARLIDTTVLVAVERLRRPISILRELGKGEPIAISSISAAELLLGVERADTDERRDRRAEFIESILADIPILPYDLEVARVHARIWAHLLARGLPIAQHDLMIAATALTHGYGMLTHNLRHFERVPGLAVEALVLPDN